MLHWIHSTSNSLINFLVFADKPLIGLNLNWCAISLLACPELINFCSQSTEFTLFPGPRSVQQFLCICKKNADRIEFKFCGQTHYGPSQAWWNFVTLHWTPIIFWPLICREIGLRPDRTTGAQWVGLKLTHESKWGYCTVNASAKRAPLLTPSISDTLFPPRV